MTSDSTSIHCPITHNQCVTAECLHTGCCMQRGVAYSQVQQEECPHDWQIWPETDGQNQCCKLCHTFRETPEEDKLWLKKSPEEISKKVAEAQADALEAHSLKYHHCAQIFALSSGKYALFGSYQVASGIDLLAIGTWAELEKHVKAYRVLADERAAEPRRISQKPRTATAAADYADLFGDD